MTVTAARPPLEAIATSRSNVTRYLEATAFVAAWMALGWLLDADPEGYLLLGVPLTALGAVVVAL